MAVIKAVSSKAGIGHAIDYVTKKEKTEEKLVSGLHCEPETVKEEMQATKELWGKTDGRTYKHYVQSYHEDEEITPEQAHKNAVELAEHTKAWKGHEVLIATHIDKGHIHTHFIVNSVNYENGHKLQWIWNGGRNREEELLANCYFNSMKLAMDNGIRSIAFPSISTGVYSFPVELAAKIAVHTVNRFLQDNPDCFDLVEWVLFDTHTESVYESEVDKIYNK